MNMFELIIYLSLYSLLLPSVLLLAFGLSDSQRSLDRRIDNSYELLIERI